MKNTAKFPYRVTPMDPDFRREPKTDHYCVLCQRDIKPGSKFRNVMWELDVWYAVHGEDWDIAKADINKRRGPQNSALYGPVEIAPVGMDCARKLGIEFTKVPD